MNRIININVSATFALALLQACYNVGQLVGRRETKRANVYILKSSDEEGFKLATTYDSAIPGGPWGILLGSARWSATRAEYVASTNDFLDDDMKLKLQERIESGIAYGRQAYDEAQAINETLETLEEKAFVLFPSKYAKTAYFERKEDAEAWAEANASNHYPTEVVWLSIERDTFTRAIVGRYKEETGIALDGLYYAFVSNSPLEEDPAASGVCVHGKPQHEDCQDCTSTDPFTEA